MKARMYDPDTGKEQEVDDSGAINIISRLHIETHRGKAYDVGNVFVGPIADNAYIDLLLKVQPNEVLHIAMTAQVEARALFSVIQGPTVTGDGTPITPRNLNRHFSDSSQHLWFHSPTGIAGGTNLTTQLIPAGEHNKGGGFTGSFVENNLVPVGNVETLYAIRCQNISGGAVAYAGLYMIYYAVPYTP